MPLDHEDITPPQSPGSPAVVATVTRAPATTADPLYATVTSLNVEFGPMPWPRDGAYKPVVGDEVLLLMPLNGDVWCVATNRNGA